MEVLASQAKIRFRVGDATLTSKLIDGSFPDYVRVIPAAIRSFMTFSTNADLAQAVDRVSTLSRKKAAR